MRKIAYGYNRTEHDFSGVDEVFLDMPGGDRKERREMLQMGLRSGDELHVLKIGDLGTGRDLTAVRRKVDQIGAKIVVLNKANPRGAPVLFDPTPEQDKEIQRYWYQPGVFMEKGCVRRATKLCGYPVSRGQLRYRYGDRNKLESSPSDAD